MANSRSQYPLGVNPFERAILTPRPLGHNDAASPDSTSLLGDTPGPLGINDHADPLVAAKAKEDSRKMAASSLKADMRPCMYAGRRVVEPSRKITIQDNANVNNCTGDGHPRCCR